MEEMEKLKNFPLPVKALAEMVSLGTTPNVPLQDCPSPAHTVSDPDGEDSVPWSLAAHVYEDINLITQKEKIETIQVMKKSFNKFKTHFQF